MVKCTIGDALKQGIALLNQNLIDTAGLDARVIMCFVLSCDKLYLAVYSGNELESIQVAILSDFNFKADVLSIPANTENKTVKVFLWSSDLKPIDFMKISEQTDILFDRD